ncbi:MAG: hypothetical protein COW66_02880 [Flavobacteriaceae bacterium CG18_big_fil_WC_8_21_14_2_50_34_36]|nr:MAG: hypothetical protein COW66_02880 [Flavobacteriaceae bacterium CG18_big_fil_WC_8_21_14_2_50_34_36]
MVNNSKGEILYVGGFNFDKNYASSIRVIENARFFQTLNYNVKILGKITLKNEANSLLIKNIEVFDIETSKFDFASDISPIKSKVESSLKKIDYIIAYNYPPIAFFKLLKYCSSKNIVLIPDLTEWYGIDGKFTVMKGMRLILNEWRMFVLNKKCNNFILASSYLNNKYKNSNSLLLPFVTIDELKKVQPNILDRKNVNFVYAGSPGKNFSKDRLDIIIKAFARVKTNQNNFTLKIVGLTLSDLLKETIIKEDVIKLADNLICYGRVDNELCVSIIKQSNFVVFARDINRVTCAGYPTKVFEAFKYGLPVITNKTSDIELHVNSSNGFMLEKADVKEFQNCIGTILSSEIEALETIINNCRENNPFLAKYYKRNTEHFFKNIIQ